MKKRESQIESILFAAGRPVSIRSLGKLLDIPLEELHALLGALQDHYQKEERGIRLTLSQTEAELSTSR